MNEWLKKFISQIKDLWAKWSIVQKIILFGIIIAVIGVLIFVVSFSAQSTAVRLFDTPITDVSVRDKIIFRLAEENVSVNVDAAGYIFVDDAMTARRWRSILIREDLIPSDMDPWALFDVERWTKTDFERNVDMRRAITEMVKQHIEALDDVDSANVVITMPQKELFAADQNPVTATVTLHTKPGSDLANNKKKVEGIQKILLKAIEGLTAENVIISDSAGNQLNEFEGMKDFERVDLIAKEQRLISNLEKEYRDRILRSLQETYTADRVRDLNVKIEMDMSKKVIDTTEYFPFTLKADNPDTPYDDSELLPSVTISSEEIKKEWVGTGFNPDGPAGIEGQNPPVYSDMNSLQGKSSESGVKKNEVINSKITQEERSPTIDRITVSVNIDGLWREKLDAKGNKVLTEEGRIERQYIELTQKQLDDAKVLIQDAIGYNPRRNDSVTVRNVAFDREAQFLREDMEYIHRKQTERTIVIVLSGIAFVLIAFIIFRFISRELERRRRIREDELLRQHQMEREKILWESEQAGLDVQMSVEERKRAELQEAAIAMAKEHPEDVAMLIRTWLMED